jgi:molybdopterin/thiamine biosynthesis adenylyltransferase
VLAKNIDNLITRVVEYYSGADGLECPAISLKSVGAISRAERIPIKQIEIAALRKDIVPWRYIRNIGSVGVEGQLKLLESSVAVVGCGGLGGTIVELLARQGVGQITLIDDDRFSEQNLNRQLICTEKNLGKYKAVETARRVKQVNSAVTVKTCRAKLNGENATRLLKGAKVVADALDNLPSRFTLEQACRHLKIPLVHGTIAGFFGQLTTIYPEDAGLSCIYGSHGRLPEKGIEVKIGNPSATPAVVAAWQVQEIVKIVTGIGKPLRNSLLVLDLIDGTADRIEFTR